VDTTVVVAVVTVVGAVIVAVIKMGERKAKTLNGDYVRNETCKARGSSVDRQFQGLEKALDKVEKKFDDGFAVVSDQLRGIYDRLNQGD